MIPKLIHQTAKTAEISEECRPYVEKLKRLHPDWTYKLWTDQDNLEFVQKEFPDFLAVYQALPRNIMRADVIRYLLMYRFGGLYLDTDYEMLKPFDMTGGDIVLCWEPDPKNPSENGKIANSHFASAPGHPFFKMLIDDLTANPPLAPDIDVLKATGPDFMTRVYQTALKSGLDPYVAPHALFSPLSPRDEREYKTILNKGVAYGIHHCHGSWRVYTFPQRVRNSLSRLVHKFI